MARTLQDLVQTLESLPQNTRQEYIEQFLDELTAVPDGDQAWESAFKHPESDNLLRQMADEARAEDQAGQARPLSELLDRYRDV